MELSELNKEIKNWTKEIKDDPFYSFAYYKRGFAYFSARKLDEAIEDFTKAISLDSDDEWAYTYRGLANHALGNKKEAIRDWEVAADMGNQLAREALNRYSK